jgi:hypothetical protein
MSFETSQNQEFPTFFRRGELVFLREGRENGPEKKQVVVAKLLSDIRVGTVLAIDNHVEVGVVESVQKSGDSIQVKTSAGLYEVGKVFRGLTIDSEIGTVSLPVDAKFAQLAPGSAKSLNIGGGAVHIEINRDALKGVLLETNGSLSIDPRQVQMGNDKATGIRFLAIPGLGLLRAPCLVMVICIIIPPLLVSKICSTQI